MSLRDSLLRFVQAFGVQTTDTAICNAHCKIDVRVARWLLMAQDRIQDGPLPITHEVLSDKAWHAPRRRDGGVEGAAATRTDFVSARGNRD